jgi:hypothetical protein
MICNLTIGVRKKQACIQHRGPAASEKVELSLSEGYLVQTSGS